MDPMPHRLCYPLACHGCAMRRHNWRRLPRQCDFHASWYSLGAWEGVSNVGSYEGGGSLSPCRQQPWYGGLKRVEVSANSGGALSECFEGLRYGFSASRLRVASSHRDQSASATAG
jgi:hypothetical protein